MEMNKLLYGEIVMPHTGSVHWLVMLDVRGFLTD